MKQKLDSIKHKNLLKSLNFVILGGSFGIIFFNITMGAPIAGFAKSIGFGDFLYGLMLALPVLGGVAQVFASYFLERGNKRKRFFLLGGFFHRFPWILIAVLPVLLPRGSYLLLIFLVLLMTISSISNSWINVSFWSWMGDLVPESIRGRFFAKRGTILTITGMLAGLIVGSFLDKHNNIQGFMWVFLFAAIMGLIDIFCFLPVEDPPMKKIESKLNIFEMFKLTLKNNYFKRFMFFFIIWNFGLNISAPYFNMYMIKDLKMSYFEIIFITQIISNLTTIITLPFIGRIVDRIGNKPVLFTATLLVSFLPYVWCFTNPTNYRYIIPFVSIISGVLWPAIDMSNNNLILKLSDPAQKSMFVASINLFNSIFGNSLGIILGGYLVENVAPHMIKYFSAYNIHLANYFIVFIISGLIRLMSVFILAKKVHEPGSLSIKTEIFNKIKKSFII